MGGGGGGEGEYVLSRVVNHWTYVPIDSSLWDDANCADDVRSAATDPSRARTFLTSERSALRGESRCPLSGTMIRSYDREVSTPTTARTAVGHCWLRILNVTNCNPASDSSVANLSRSIDRSSDGRVYGARLLRIESAVGDVLCIRYMENIFI